MSDLQGNKPNYPFILGGLMLAGGAGYLVYSNYYQKKQCNIEISRDFTLKVLKEFQK